MRPYLISISLVSAEWIPAPRQPHHSGGNSDHRYIRRSPELLAGP